MLFQLPAMACPYLHFPGPNDSDRAYLHSITHYRRELTPFKPCSYSDKLSGRFNQELTLTILEVTPISQWATVRGYGINAISVGY